MLKVEEEVAKLLALKAQLGDDGPKKFVLKTPKVINIYLLLVSFFVNCALEYLVLYFENCCMMCLLKSINGNTFEKLE